MHAQGLTEQELHVKCRSELRKMAMRIHSGEQIPPPRPQVEMLYVPTSTARVMVDIGYLKFLLNKLEKCHAY